MNEADRLKLVVSGIPPGPPSSPTEFTTQSAHCAAWLLYCGHAPQQFRSVAPRKGEFVFGLTPELQKNVGEYFDGTAQARLKDFIRAYNKIRDVIMDHRRRPETITTAGGEK